ncbi:DUF1566 domain-containing protein [Spirochaetia bacterium 38H-sp]|uniref:DUF1566 domain-containing protein n=1 Tax=Rarispira pelagica TaxID=3141764 RepID=A0ABU9UCP9_9SPIR
MIRKKVMTVLSVVFLLVGNGYALDYPIVHTGITKWYDDKGEISAPSQGKDFYGQDADYRENMPRYKDNGDGTVTDLVTGLMWEADMGEKMTFDEAQEKAKTSRLGGYDDWRIPTIKELYSLINYSGRVMGDRAIDMFIDTRYFKQPIGDVKKGEREIDAQTWSATEYVGKTMRGAETVFGVNFVDGRIKGYPKYDPRTGKPNKMYFRLVRGNPDYGKNRFIDNGDGTISDLATGLMWQKADSGRGMDWEDALRYAQELELAGYKDWRLPSAKELQSIVDYTRAPSVTNTAAIDPVFDISTFIDPRGKRDYPFFWTATTLLDGPRPGNMAVYVCFGTALGKMRGQLMDVHGAGAVRSDPKSGDKREYPKYFGPQGDVQYVYNYVRCVRTIR